MIIHKKGSLFLAPKGSIIAHACNTHGRWGSGVAAEFARLFPDSYKEHQKYCSSQKGSDLLGTTQLMIDKEYIIAAFFTSISYGREVDPPEKILQSTEKALKDFFNILKDEGLSDFRELHIPKINSVLFKTPWEETEKILTKVLEEIDPDFTITVWSL